MKYGEKKYSEAELRFVEERKTLPRRELSAQFAKRFKRENVTVNALNSLCSKRGWFSERADAPRSYSKVELAFLSKNRKMSKPRLHALFVVTFNRPDVTCFNIRDIFRRENWQGPGPNNGRKKPMGSERVSKGFLKIKVRNELGARHHHRNYIFKHHLLWEKLNGPIPAGHKLKCIDGNRLNCEPSNWVCVPNGVIVRINKRNFANAPSELKPTIIAVSKLEHIAASRGR